MTKGVGDSKETDKRKNAVPWWTSCRLTLSIIGFLGTICLYMMRANMSVAIVCMTNDPNNTLPVNGTEDNSTVTVYTGSTCPDLGADGENKKVREFDWPRDVRGWVLSSFYVGYLLTQVLGGWLANRLGAKRIIGAGMVSLTVLTLLTPVSARASVYILMTVQALKGFVSGVYYPAFYQLWGRWAPPGERTILLTIFLIGSPIGSVLSSIFSGLLCEYGFDGGWPSIFYVFGSISAVWCIVWFLVAFSSPAEHPRISEAELNYLQTSLGSISEKKTLHVPWKQLLSTVPLYSIFVANVCYAWCWYVALSSLPQYMKDVLKFDMKKNGFYNSLPYLCNFVLSLASSVLADFIINKQFDVKVTWIRKIFHTVGMVGGAAMAFGVAFLTCQQVTVAIVLLSFWIGAFGFIRAGPQVSLVEMAPKFTGVLGGIDNTLATIPGIIAPPIINAMTSTGGTAEWQRVFFLCSGISILGWLSFLVFGSSEEQDWARGDPSLGSDPEKKDVKAIENSAFIGSHDNIPSSKRHVEQDKNEHYRF